MKLEKVITLANQTVRLQFLAMERSLRSTGCQLPILVIPYSGDLFDLPEGSSWWGVPALVNWIKAEMMHPTMRKYQCLTVNNYQFVDTDICFLQNPESVLEPYSGFITSCGHWRNPAHTLIPKSQQWIAQRTTTWQWKVFNTGQFACDQILYSINDLQETAMHPDFKDTCVRFIHHEQPGVNLLVWQSGVKITNLTLPPTCMESTWAGDYPENYKHYWNSTQKTPYLIHWAGNKPGMYNREIDQIFYSFLTVAEKAEWNKQISSMKLKQQQKAQSLKSIARRVKRVFQIFSKI